METYLNILKVIEVVSTKGRGTNGDPVREGRDYFLEDGTRLCSFDPVINSRVIKANNADNIFV